MQIAVFAAIKGKNNRDILRNNCNLFVMARILELEVNEFRFPACTKEQNCKSNGVVQWPAHIPFLFLYKFNSLSFSCKKINYEKNSNKAEGTKHMFKSISADTFGEKEKIPDGRHVVALQKIFY